MSIPSLPPAAPAPAGPSPSSGSSKTPSSAGDFHKLVQQHLDRDDRGRARTADRREHDAHPGTTDRGRARADKAPVARRAVADETRGVDQGQAAPGQPLQAAPSGTSTPVVVPSTAAPAAEAAAVAGTSGSAAPVGGVAARAALAGQVVSALSGTGAAVAGQATPSVQGGQAVPAGGAVVTAPAGSGATGTAATGTATNSPAATGTLTAGTLTASTPAAGVTATGAAEATTTAAASGVSTSEIASAVPGSDTSAATSSEAGPSTDKATSQPPTSKEAEVTARDAGASAQALGSTVPQPGQAPQVAAAAPAAADAPGRAAATTSSQVLDQVLPAVPRLVSRGDGTQRLTLKLHPADLGEVHLTVTVKGGSVDVTLAAGHEAREALRDGSSQLRDLLQLTGHTTGTVVFRDLATPSSTPASSPGAQSGHQGFSGGDSSPTFTENGGGRGRQEQGAGRSGSPFSEGRPPVVPESPTRVTQAAAGTAAVDVRI